MSKELKACPFCGGEAENDFGFKCHDTETYFYVVCLKCGAEAIGYKTDAEAIAAWNRRYVNKCTWAVGNEDTGLYNTECGQAFVLNDGTLKDNKMMFCCYCGGELMESESEE